MVELKVRIKRERLLEQILTLASTWLKVLIFLDTYVIKIYHYHLHIYNYHHCYHQHHRHHGDKKGAGR